MLTNEVILLQHWLHWKSWDNDEIASLKSLPLAF